MSPDRARRRRTPLVGKLALACVSACATLAALELGLRSVAALRSGRAPQVLGPKQRDDGTRVTRILCLGDSNTYGLYERTEDAWPARVEALLGARALPGRAFEVVNDGFPGQNSSDLRVRCESAIERTDPDLLVVWVGKNNTWSTRNMEPYLDGASAAAGPAILRDLSLYRFFRTLEGRHVSEKSIDLRDLSRGAGVSGSDAFEISLQYGEGGSDVELELALRALREDLRSIAATARARALPMLVLAYPLDLDRLAALNRCLVECARDAPWQLADPRAWIAAALRRARYEVLFHHDFHLRAKGYEALAPWLAHACAAALDEGAAITAPALADLDALLGAPPRKLALEGDGGGPEAPFRVRANGVAGERFLLLGGTAADDAPGTPLPPYHLLPIVFEDFVSKGVLDEHGSAQLTVSRSWAGKRLVLATQKPPFEDGALLRIDAESFGLSDPLELPR